MRTATEQFLTGRKVTASGHVYRTDDGDIVPDLFLCTGPVPGQPGVMRLQDTIDRSITVDIAIEFIWLPGDKRPTAEQVGWDVEANLLPPHG